MRLIDEQYTRTPFYGARRMAVFLGSQGVAADRKRVRRLMIKMGLEAIYPKPRLTLRAPEHRIYPYLLNGVSPKGPNHIWSTDITYIRMRQGFLFLVAILDWYSRCVLSWELSNTMEVSFCVDALRRALDRHGRPEIFNSDQGSQFTSNDFTGALLQEDIRISMDGRGRWADNVFVERLWRTVKYEEVYLKDYESGHQAFQTCPAISTSTTPSDRTRRSTIAPPQPSTTALDGQYNYDEPHSTSNLGSPVSCLDNRGHHTYQAHDANVPTLSAETQLERWCADDARADERPPEYVIPGPLQGVLKPKLVAH
jgi:putative transposase